MLLHIARLSIEFAVIVIVSCKREGLENLGRCQVSHGWPFCSQLTLVPIRVLIVLAMIWFVFNVLVVSSRAPLSAIHSLGGRLSKHSKNFSLPGDFLQQGLNLVLLLLNTPVHVTQVPQCSQSLAYSCL